MSIDHQTVPMASFLHHHTIGELYDATRAVVVLLHSYTILIYINADQKLLFIQGKDTLEIIKV
jgi:hypothetical protein